MKNIRKPEIELWYNFHSNIMRVVYINNPRKKQKCLLLYGLYPWKKSTLKSSDIEEIEWLGYEKIGEL